MVDAAPARAVPSRTSPAPTSAFTAVCTLWTLIPDIRARSLNDAPGTPEMCPSSPRRLTVRPSGASAAPSAASTRWATVSSTTEGLVGGVLTGADPSAPFSPHAELQLPVDAPLHRRNRPERFAQRDAGDRAEIDGPYEVVGFLSGAQLLHLVSEAQLQHEVEGLLEG